MFAAKICDFQVIINHEFVKSLKMSRNRRLRKKVRRQGAQILRNEAYLAYAAMTKDVAQRSIRTFYVVVINRFSRRGR
jgi:hypothetical protein